MNFLLIHPQINSPILAYSYGLGYLISALEQGGHSAGYVSLKSKDDIRVLYERTESTKPDVIGISIMSAEFAYIGELAANLRRISSAFIICGGTHPTLLPDSVAGVAGVDALVRGEGEMALLEFADKFQRGEDYLKTENFWFMRDGSVIKNSVRQPVDINTLPFPSKKSFNYQQLIDMYDGTNRFLFNRGCPFNCPYCINKAMRDLYNGSERYFRFLSPIKAIEEIELDARTYRFKKIFFDDDLITLNKKWFYEFFTLYKSKFDYPFVCNARAGTIDAGMMKLLKDAGAEGIAMGIEHGNEHFRKTVLKRAISNDLLIETFRSARQQGISRLYGHVMVGIPFETITLFCETVELFRTLNVDFFLSIFTPYPGTEFWNLCSTNGWLPDKNFSSSRNKAAISYPSFSSENIQLCYFLFPYLVRYKFLRLEVPFFTTEKLFLIYRSSIHAGLWLNRQAGATIRIMRRLKSVVKRVLRISIANG